MRTAAAEPAATHPHLDEFDQRVFLSGVSWAQYEALLAIRGEHAAVRITYLEGAVEFMSPSRGHERTKKYLARLLELWALERGVDLNGYGSWTVKKSEVERGVEPDECYILGPELKEQPDLAIEVVWTSGGLDKLAVYRGLGVPEVWFWADGVMTVWTLEAQNYARRAASRLLPDVDLALLAKLAEHPSQLEASRALLKALRGEGTAPPSAQP